MNTDKFEEFQKLYPNLFRTYPRSGCDIRPGWEKILHTLCSLLENYIKELPNEIREHIQVAQVKEKFGTLRFYMTQETPYISGAIAIVEMMTGSICETCGKPGQRRGSGWILTLCNKHHKENIKKRNTK
jgi:hypothetical protein